MGFRYVLAPDGRVDPADRGLAYGDGLFETMAVHNAAVLRIDLHLARLRAGAKRLTLPLPDDATLAAKLGAACAGIRRGALKLIVTRGIGPRGYAPPQQPEPTIILAASTRTAPYPATITAVTLQQRLSENESLAGMKHLCRLEQVLGQIELASSDADEGLMLSTSGNVIGGTSRNLVAVLGPRLVTPDLRRAGIRGVMRQAVLDQCRASGIAFEESNVQPADLTGASEIFMTNALVGIQSVARLDQRSMPSQDLAIRLRAALAQDHDD
jgi:4-amino-4-deoxychorismate lyase